MAGEVTESSRRANASAPIVAYVGLRYYLHKAVARQREATTKPRSAMRRSAKRGSLIITSILRGHRGDPCIIDLILRSYLDSQVKAF